MDPLFQPVLVADLEAIIKVIIFLVILGSGFVKMFFESKEVQQQGQRRRPRPRPPRDDASDLELEDEIELEAVEARAAAAPVPQAAIRSEVEEFLRRVGGDQPDNRRANRPQRPRPRIEVLENVVPEDGVNGGFDVDQRPKQTRRGKSASGRKRTRATPTETKAATGIERGETVAEHVSQHLKRDDFDKRAQHMGEQLSQTDERLEARLHEKFDHGLGSLAARREAREAADLAKITTEKDAQLADSLVQMLKTPQGVRQAVILSEVFNRPVDRW